MDNQITANPQQQSTPVAPLKNPDGKLKRAIIFIIIFAATAYLIGGLIWVAGDRFNTKKACTQEAKKCPDGSFVGRTGPNCEFSACPEPTNDTKDSKNDDLKTYSSKKLGFSFTYPSNWKISEQESTVILEPIVGVGREFPPSGGIEIMEKSKFSSAREYALTLDKDLVFKQFKLGDTEGVETLLPGIGDGYKDIFILRGEYIYHLGFSLGYDDSVRDTLKNSYDQILQTFKFTTTDTEEAIKQNLYSQLNPSGISGFEIKVQKVSGNYAYGVSGVPPSSVAWIATKISGAWKSIWEGQNSPSCSLMTQYEVPKTIYDSCSTNY